MLGGTSLEVAPTALYIKSGDIVIMSGESRQYYHGIPKIVATQESPWDTEEVSCNGSETVVPNDESTDSVKGHPYKRARIEKKLAAKSDTESTRLKILDDSVVNSVLNDNFWEPFRTYIAKSRINMNVRQVLTKEKRTLNNKDA